VQRKPQVSLRPAGTADEPLLHDLFGQGRREALVAAGLAEREIELLVELERRAQDACHRESFPDSDNLIVEADGVPAGRLLLERRAGEIRIVDIVLLGEHRGRGICSRVLRMLQAEAAFAQKVVGLRIEAGSPVQRVFEEHGFRAVAADEEFVELAWEAGTRRIRPAKRRGHRRMRGGGRRTA